MAQAERPLSPHLGIYRWQISNSLSILHRLTGVMLSFGAVMLVTWLVSIASGYNEYTAVKGFLNSWVGVTALFGWTFCFCYHLCNGIRHLAWDAGKGFEKRSAQISGMIVVAAAILMTTVFWWSVFTASGGQS